MANPGAIPVLLVGAVFFLIFRSLRKRFSTYGYKARKTATWALFGFLAAALGPITTMLVMLLNGVGSLAFIQLLIAITFGVMLAVVLGALGRLTAKPSDYKEDAPGA